jgi:hypothetical protein
MQLHSMHYLDINKLIHRQYTSKPFILIRTAEQTGRMTYLLVKMCLRTYISCYTPADMALYGAIKTGHKL